MSVRRCVRPVVVTSRAQSVQGIGAWMSVSSWGLMDVGDMDLAVSCSVFTLSSISRMYSPQAMQVSG